MLEFFDFQYHGMNIGQFLIWFFIYSFLGWGMECIVIRKELGYWENRGFAKLPFCVIYGFGTFIAITLFTPIEDNWILLYVVCAVAATALEYSVAMVMLKMFGKVWWNYDHKKINYKGILCLDSTIGWGFLGIFVFHFLNKPLESVLKTVPVYIANFVGLILVMAYVIDFTYHFVKRRGVSDVETELAVTKEVE